MRAYAVHPGVVATSLARHMTRDDFTALTQFDARRIRRRQKIDVRRDFTMPEQGAATQVWAAVSPDVGGRRICVPGGLRDPRRRRAVRASTRTHALALWELSERLCAVGDPAMNRMDRRKMEVRDRILGAAFDLFLSQGVSATTIEEICERADVANRTFFNHFPTRQDMMRALAESRLLNLHDVVVDRGDRTRSRSAGRPVRRHRHVRWSSPAIRIAR